MKPQVNSFVKLGKTKNCLQYQGSNTHSQFTGVRLFHNQTVLSNRAINLDESHFYFEIHLKQGSKG